RSPTGAGRPRGYLRAEWRARTRLVASTAERPWTILRIVGCEYVRDADPTRARARASAGGDCKSVPGFRALVRGPDECERSGGPGVVSSAGGALGEGAQRRR